MSNTDKYVIDAYKRVAEWKNTKEPLLFDVWRAYPAITCVKIAEILDRLNLKFKFEKR